MADIIEVCGVKVNVLIGGSLDATKAQCLGFEIIHEHRGKRFWHLMLEAIPSKLLDEEWVSWLVDWAS